MRDVHVVCRLIYAVVPVYPTYVYVYLLYSSEYTPIIGAFKTRYGPLNVGRVHGVRKSKCRHFRA